METITNPQEEIDVLTENIDMLETQIEELETAQETNGELSPIDAKALEVYTAINDLQIELLDFIESEMGGAETDTAVEETA